MYPGFEHPSLQVVSSSPAYRGVDSGDAAMASTDIFQSPPVTALGSSAALGGAAAIAAVTASVIPLIHHSLRTNSRISASRNKDMSRCLSANSNTSLRIDRESISMNGKL